MRYQVFLQSRGRAWLGYASAVMLMTFYYFILLDFGSKKAHPSLEFNSMLSHLLQFRFDVDPEVIGIEGYLRGGRVYAYWGVVPALLRLVIVPVREWRNWDVTIASCCCAAALVGLLNVLALKEVSLSSPQPFTQRPMLAALVLSAVAGGSVVPFLRLSVYQEVVFWAAVFASGFVLLALRGLLRMRGFSGGVLCGMSACAALALSTRVSVGIGLYAGECALILWLLIGHGRKLDKGLISAAGILATGLLAAGLVNTMRFGNPFTFADLRLVIGLANYPDRLPRLERYGEIDVRRIWYGLIYYFFPIWAVTRGNGKLLFAASDQDLMDATELPPSSFLLSDPLLVALSVFVLYRLSQKTSAVMRLDRVACVALLAGLALPCFILLSALSFNFRYRMDFEPFLNLGGCLGLYLLAARPEPFRPRLTFIVASLSMIGAHLMMVANKISPFGPARNMLPSGIPDWSHFYYWRLSSLFGL